MFPSADQILPSIEALGVWGYWIIGLAAMLETWFVTGVFVPGAMIVDAGGLLVQRGVLDPIDLGWFVVAGSVAGGELGYWTGRLAQRGLRGRLEGSRTYARAVRLFERRGGLALVIGRMLGPLSGLVPVAAALAGMPHRRFLAWTIVAAFPYAIFHLTLGYFLGGVLGQLGPLATRIALVVLAVLLLVGGLILLVARALRLMPFVLSVLAGAARALAALPPVRAFVARHPGMAAFVARRLQPGRFTGLPVSVLALVFLYLLSVWVGSVLDWLNAAPILAIDTRAANLMHAFWTPGALRLATHVTALGDTRVVAVLTLALTLWAVVRGRRDLALGLVAAVIGNALSVTVLKLIFQRTRPPFAYFVETTNSFPSGHAAISAAFWGSAFYLAWRLGWLKLPVALVLAPLTALVIGGSRVYLAQHYLSDVFNGWLVGTLWLLAGIVLAEWWFETHPRSPPISRARRVAGPLALALVLGAGWFTVFYDRAQSMPWAGPGSVTLANPAALMGAPGFSPQAESVLGTPLAPVTLIMVAADERAVDRALGQAGWVPAQRPGAGTVAHEVWLAWRHLDDPMAPVMPYFWDGVPNTSVWQPATSPDIPPPHLHLWRSRYATGDGLHLWVGALDAGAGPGAPDAARDGLAAALIAGGAEDLGRTATGARQPNEGPAWSTDGQAVILRLR